MVYEPEVSILTGRISDIGGGYVWLESGTRVATLPAMETRALRVGMQVTMRAIRRHGQYIAESIMVEQPPGGAE